MNGTLSRAGWAPASSWAAAYSETSMKQLRLVSENLTENYDKIRSSALLGSAADNEFYLGHVMISGEVVVDLAYDNSEIIEYCMGAAATTTYTFTDQLSKVFHLLIDKNSAAADDSGSTNLNKFRYRFAGVKVNSFTISGEVGESPVKLTMQVTCRSVATVATVFPTLTAPDEPIPFKHLTSCWVGDQADALASGDALSVKSFEIAVDNNLKSDDKDSGDVSYVLEPLRNGFRKVTAKFGLARYLTSSPTADLRTWKTAGTRLQALLVLTNGTDSYTIRIPEMKVVDGVNWNVGGPAMIESDVTFEAFNNSSNANTGMSTITSQMNIVAA